VYCTPSAFSLPTYGSEIAFKKASANIAYNYLQRNHTKMKQDSKNVLDEATSLCQEERELEAETLVKEQLELDPHNLELLAKLGEIQVRLCKDTEAESAFRMVLEKNPHHEDAVCGLGRLLDQTLRTEEAEQLYKNFLQNNPRGHCALEDLCRLLVSEDRIDEALKLARAQVDQYGDFVNAYDALRYVLHILEDRLEADLNDDRRNEAIFSQLVDNLFEQLELIMTLNSRIEPQDDIQEELEDDKTRLIGEIEYLLGSGASRNISVPKDLHNRILGYKK